MAAARAQGVEVIVGSDERQSLEGFSNGGTFVVNFRDSEIGLRQILDHAAEYPVQAVIGVDEITVHLAALANHADVPLDVRVPEEACPLGLAPTASTTATLAMGDALAMVVLDHRGFCAEDFALFHPGGALGKRLILTAADLMHTGDKVPRVGMDASMQDTLFEISAKRLGITTVLNADRTLAGIITDGDLRRGFERFGKGYLDIPAGEAMTRSPRTIAEKTMASEAMAIMEERKITSLVVLDEVGCVRGILHLHDLLKSGIV